MDNKQAEVEQLKEQEDVKAALKQTTGTKESMPKPVAEWKDKLWFVTYIAILLGLGALYYLLGSDLFPTDTQAIPTLVRAYRELLRQTPVGELQIHEHPVVHFRASENTWLEAIVRYVVPPKESGRIKTRLTKKLLEKLNAEPERVLFPKSNLR